MGFTRTRKWLKRSLWGLAGGFLFLVLVGFAAYRFRTEIAQSFLDQLLAENGFADSEINFSRIDWDGLSVENGRLVSGGTTLTFDALDIRYDLETVWKQNTLESVEFDGVNLRYDLTGPSTLDSNELDALIKQGIPFPLKTLTVSNANITLLTDVGPLSYQISLRLSLDETNTISGQLSARSAFESFKLDLTVDDRISFSAEASFSDLNQTLATLGLEKLDRFGLPPELQISPSSLMATAKGSFHGMALEQASVTARLGGLQVELSPGKGKANIEQIVSSIQMSASEIQKFDTQIQLKDARIGPLEIKETRISLTGSTPLKPTIVITETDWALDSGEFGRIDASITANLNDDYTLNRFELKGNARELKSESFALQPFLFHAAGDSHAIAITLSDIVNPAFSWLALSNFQATVEDPLSDEASVQIRATVSATDHGSSENALPAPVEGTWELSGRIAPKANPFALNLSLRSPEQSPLLITQKSELKGRGALDLSLNYWPDTNEASVTMEIVTHDVGFEIDPWSAEGIGLKLHLNSEPIILTDFSDRLNDTQDLADFLARSMDFTFDFQGNKIHLSPDTSLQWFSGRLYSVPLEDTLPDDPSSLAANLDLQVGIANTGIEQGQQIELHSALHGTARAMTFDSSATGLFEGEPVTLQSRERLQLENKTLQGSGEFAISGIRLVSSNILDRHSPDLSGTAFSADIEIQGKTKIESNAWDAQARIRIADGSFSYPAEELSIDGLSGDIAFESVTQLRTPLSQRLRANVLKIGDIESTDINVMFSLPNADEIFLEQSSLRAFEGSISLDPLHLSLNHPDANLTLRFDKISVAPVIAMMDFFDGQVTGRLNGALPIQLIDGRPVFGEGHLELDPGSKATFAYNAKGLFTDDGGPSGPKKTWADKLLEKLDLEPNALVEDALGNLTIHQLRVDLFDKDFPDTPMRIQLAGLADTGKATIPLAITTNVNGTVAELLNFLTRLDSLGLVAAKQSSHRP